MNNKATEFTSLCFMLLPLLEEFVFLLIVHIPGESFPPNSHWHSLLHNISNWLIRYQRWSSLCKCSLNNSYRAVRERERRGILEISSLSPWPWIIDLNWLKFAVITPYLPNRKTPHLCLLSLYLFSSFSPPSRSNMFQLTTYDHAAGGGHFSIVRVSHSVSSIYGDKPDLNASPRTLYWYSENGTWLLSVYVPDKNIIILSLTAVQNIIHLLGILLKCWKHISPPPPSGGGTDLQLATESVWDTTVIATGVLSDTL